MDEEVVEEEEDEEDARREKYRLLRPGGWVEPHPLELDMQPGISTVEEVLQCAVSPPGPPQEAGGGAEQLPSFPRPASSDKERLAGLELEEADMEICDPCYCYTKCWLDTVASLFCVSLL